MNTVIAVCAETAQGIAFQYSLTFPDYRFRLLPGLLQERDKIARRQGYAYNRGLTGNFLVVAQPQSTVKVMKPVSGLARLCRWNGIHPALPACREIGRAQPTEA